jgi:hypothetical protein
VVTSSLSGFAKEIGVHDPALFASRFRADSFDVVHDIRQPAVTEK